ncbi:MAG: 4Fe-4S dicluster domain-containing protein [Thermodesulfobacteriota bacterium]
MPTAEKGSDLIFLPRENKGFAREVARRSGNPFSVCYTCLTCTCACPFVHAMDHPPVSILRMTLLGREAEVLNSNTIWLCVGCNSCAEACPQGVDTPAVMDALRQMALERGIAVPEPQVLAFHREVLSSIESYGRTHKLAVMAGYKIKTRDFFTDADVGLKMFLKGKLDLLPSKVEDVESIRRIFRKHGMDK